MVRRAARQANAPPPVLFEAPGTPAVVFALFRQRGGWSAGRRTNSAPCGAGAPGEGRSPPDAPSRRLPSPPLRRRPAPGRASRKAFAPYVSELLAAGS